MTSLLFTVDPAARDPLWKQITDRVSRLVDEGTLATGDRLPPTRVLARELGVNRSTVCRAYEELWALGYLESRQGSYSTVRGRARVPGVAAGSGGRSLVNWERRWAPGPRAAFRGLAAVPEVPEAGPGSIDFGSLTADPDLCPADDFRRAVRRVLLDDGRRLLDYGDPAGFRPLRETLARRLRAHGVSVSADEVLLTQGAQQALDLVVRLLCPPGAEMVVEAPTYGLALPLLRMAGVRPIEVPMTLEGLDLDRLERSLGRRPALVYTVPTFHNPTGVTTSQAHRERLLALCEARRVPILEDGFEEDMKYFGRAVLPIKSMDVHGLVFYVGTLSKVVFPGLRVGWIAADREAIRRLAVVKRYTSLSDNVVAQAAVERFCRSGRYDAYLRRLHATFRRRLTAMVRGLTRRVPPGALEWREPAGGCTLWARVVGARRADEAAFIEYTREAGVTVTPGSLFFATPVDALYVRLSLAKVKAHDVDEGCRRLARAIERLAARRA